MEQGEATEVFAFFILKSTFKEEKVCYSLKYFQTCGFATAFCFSFSSFSSAIYLLLQLLFSSFSSSLLCCNIFYPFSLISIGSLAAHLVT